MAATPATGVKALQLVLLGVDAGQVSTLVVALRQALHLAEIPALISTSLESVPLDSLCLLLALGVEASTAQRESQAQLRLRLGASPSGYQVIHGENAEALRQALAAAQAHAGRPIDQSLIKRQPWVWSCEKCSDSDCEYRLLSDLLVLRDSRSSNA